MVLENFIAKHKFCIDLNQILIPIIFAQYLLLTEETLKSGTTEVLHQKKRMKNKSYNRDIREWMHVCSGMNMCYRRRRCRQRFYLFHRINRGYDEMWRKNDINFNSTITYIFWFPSYSSATEICMSLKVLFVFRVTHAKATHIQILPLPCH